GDVNETVDVRDSEWSETGRQIGIHEFIGSEDPGEIFIVKFHRSGVEIRHIQPRPTVRHRQGCALVNRFLSAVVECDNGMIECNLRIPPRDDSVLANEDEQAWPRMVGFADYKA